MSKGLSKDYIAAYKELKTELGNAQKFSIESPCELAEHSIDFLLSAIFIRICTTARTILLSAPQSTTIYSIWDYASFGTLLRNIMDALNAFMYLADKGITEEERDCRFLLFSLHNAVSIQKTLNFRGESKHTDLCKVRASEIKDSLSSNDFFRLLSLKKQTHYLKGTHAFLLSKEEIIEKNGGNKEDFLGLYKFLSANAHSYPMGYFGMANIEFGRGIHSVTEEDNTKMVLQLTTGQLKSLLWFYQNHKINT